MDTSELLSVTVIASIQLRKKGRKLLFFNKNQLPSLGSRLVSLPFAVQVPAVSQGEAD